MRYCTKCKEINGVYRKHGVPCCVECGEKL